ncbi:MAG: hypothetical protein ABR538_16610, partial [Candidatus Binatia bacterium]
VVASCHKARGRDGSLTATDCNDLAAADLRSKLPKAEARFTNAVASPTGRCAGVSPSESLYVSCPAPCDSVAPSVSSFTDVAACLVCLQRSAVESLAGSILGAPASPLASDDRRCNDAIAKGSSKLFQLVAKDVTRCQALDESAGSMTVDYCTNAAFPSAAVDNGDYSARNSIVGSCGLPSYDNLDSCADSQFGIAECAAAETLAGARELVSDALALPFTTTTTTSTTTSTTNTTTTTLPPDPQCPDLAELVLISRDTNIPCTTNGDCDAPRTCNTDAGICVSLSKLDSGWTGHAHNSDLDDGVVTLTRLHCPGPAPTCGECNIDGIDPSGGSCRCSNSTRTVCDEPFAADADDCGGAVCDCYFGVPIPLSSAGTPACVVNRYSQDLTGTANVDLGASNVSARLRTRVYLGISTTNPCPICGGTCSNSPTTACAFDDDCGGGNTCIQDTPNDGLRQGLCINGDSNGLSCDVGGINPSFPARSGALEGGGGYSLDCLPSVGINISGAGLVLKISQTTGTTSLEANLPCIGGECPCKTCSASPQTPCNGDFDCTGGSCAVSANFSCNSNSDCGNLNLGNCSSINRCQLATSVTCSTNADCQNYTSGGPCNPSTCTAIGGSGASPEPNDCTGLACMDMGGGEGLCATGPDDQSCDGLVKADGTGILSCTNNSDCTANHPLNGSCSLVKRRSCFLDPIVATGSADTDFPVGAAAFCVPPTSNSSINQVAGLPGPTRVINQGRARTFCAADHGIEYQPGLGGCP